MTAFNVMELVRAKKQRNQNRRRHRSGEIRKGLSQTAKRIDALKFASAV